MNSKAVTFDSYKDIKGYVINLDRERWRYDIARKELTDLGFTNIHRWEATDYHTEDVVSEMRLLGATRLDRFYNCAEMACLLSHFRAIYAFLISKEPYCMIFEDDVVAVPEFKSLQDYPAWSSSCEYRIPFMDVYMSSNRSIKNKLIAHKPKSPEKYSIGDRFGYRFRGIMFQRKDFKSTIVGA